jgi:hypothetical protein
MNLGVILSNWAFSGFMSFPDVYEVKPTSRDPGKSREMTSQFPFFRELEFPGKTESLIATTGNDI